MANEVTVTETAPEIPPEIIAAAAEAAVAEAEASVERAEIQAEAATEQTAIIADAQVEQAAIVADTAMAVSREELEECRRNSETALTLAQETQSTMQSILERLPPSPPSPSESPAGEEGAPLVVEPVAESPPEPAKKKPAIRWT